MSSAHEKWGQKQKCCVYNFVQHIYKYIYIRGVTVHRMYGPVRYDTVVSQVRFVFDMGGEGGGNWLCYNVGNISVLNHEGKPIHITQARVCARANFAQYLCW